MIPPIYIKPPCGILMYLRPGGIHLALNHRFGVNIFWQGRGGVKLDKLKRHIELLMTLEDILSAKPI
jgi:hypothetical protein